MLNTEKCIFTDTLCINKEDFIFRFENYLVLLHSEKLYKLIAFK